MVSITKKHYRHLRKELATQAMPYLSGEATRIGEQSQSRVSVHIGDYALEGPIEDMLAVARRIEAMAARIRERAAHVHELPRHPAQLQLMEG